MSGLVWVFKRLALPAALAALALAGFLPASASIAYGSINNFDTVNDTGDECHGFEIEIEDIHSSDITYTYDWNHYGTPRITEDNSDPLHPRVYVRWESGKNPDGTWKAFTAVPSAPISPTNGHQFTNPSVNFGGEHFGVGFYGRASAVRYSWLKDDGRGNLVFAGAVNISTPAFILDRPMGRPAQVQAVIVPPEPPEPPRVEFGVATWVKETRTETHNNRKVELRDLVSDDPDDPNDRNWRNNEPDEVEVEWQLMQTDYNSGDGGPNGKVVGAPEELIQGDEIITRRYDFFKYAGPVDPETGEALVQKVGPDGIHGIGFKVIKGVNVDLSTVVVVGEYIGAQMAGFDPAGQIGLIDHLQDGELNVPYVNRSVVIGGAAPILTTLTGQLPPGMHFDVASGLLSGTPAAAGAFNFAVHSVDAAGGDVSTSYRLVVNGAGGPPPPVTVTTSAAPAAGGVTVGDGPYFVGDSVTVSAAASAGFVFSNWTEGGAFISASPQYQFTAAADRDLQANFLKICTISASASPGEGGSATGSGTFTSGDTVTLIAVPSAGYRFAGWTADGAALSQEPTYRFTATSDLQVTANFVRVNVISTSSLPSAGGTATGEGAYDVGSSVTVVAEPGAGYRFLHWTEAGTVVSTATIYTFTAAADRDLVAHFEDARSLELTLVGVVPTVVGTDPVNVSARVTVRDETGAGLAGVAIQYAVTGPNAAGGEAITGADGSVVVSFAASLPGVNVLTASIPGTAQAVSLTVALSLPDSQVGARVAADGRGRSRAQRLKVNGRLAPRDMRVLVTLSDPALRAAFRSRSQDGYEIAGDRMSLWGHGAVKGVPVQYRVDLVRGRSGTMRVTLRDAGGNVLLDRGDYSGEVKLTVVTAGTTSGE